MKKIVLPLLLVAALAGSVATQGFSQMPSFMNGGTANAKETAREFIANNLVAQGTEFEIKEITEENGLYKLTLDVQGREFTSYMTKDLSTFFPSAADMKPEVAGEQDQADNQQQQQEIPQQENPEVMLFTQSFCPYGNQAEDIMKPVVELLGNQVEVEPHYVLYENYQGGGPDYCIDEDSKYCSMHGIAELNQDVRELCVYENQNDKYWDFVSQVNNDCSVNDVESCWEGAASQVGVNVGSVQSCFDNNALDYAKAERELNTELEVSASPTLLINGVRYSGERSPEAFKTAICSGFENQPEACNETLESSTQAAEGDCG
jgi:hypothetical protein